MTLKDYRNKEGISQFTMAVRAGVSPATIVNIERGNGVTASTAQAIIRATNGEVTLDDLVPVDEQVEEPKTTAGA